MVTDEELWYMDEYYSSWLRSSYNYHFNTEELPEMGDAFWDGLSRLYIKCLHRYPYLDEICFDGSTMGIDVCGDELLMECNNPRIKTWGGRS